MCKFSFIHFTIWVCIDTYSLLKRGYILIHTCSFFAFFPPYILKRINLQHLKKIIRVQNNWFTFKSELIQMGRMKHFDFTNCKHVNGWECSCCEETDEIIMDEIHGEIICLKCGLVLFDVVNTKY